MDISFITPCLNSANTLRSTLESIRREASSFDYEHIIMDGGSEDDSEKLVRDFGSPHVRWCLEPDEGAYDAMNRGIRRAKGRLVAILNSDDYYTEGAIQRVVRAAEEHPEVSLFCGNTVLLFPNGNEEVKVPDLSWRGKLGIRPPVWHPSMIVRAEVYQRVGLYDLRYPIVADVDFFFRALDQGEGALHLDHSITVMRTGGLSTRAYHSTPLEMMRMHRARPGICGLLSQAVYYKNPRFRSNGSSPADRWQYWSWALNDFFYGGEKEYGE
ncbi:MAG: glycosyltransferase family 2 protein [Puniceicoccales bacterium]